MIYKIVAIGDIHWGAIDAEKQKQELALFLSVLDKLELDLLVINGDYFDYKLALNSKSAVYAVDMMTQIHEMSKSKGFKVRIIQGTKSHDEDQLDVFNFMDDGDSFHIIRELTVEETLENCNIIYGPDENITSEEYYMTYVDRLFRRDMIHMGFFHGNFDILTNEIAVKNIKDNNLPTIMFEYNLLAHLINGPIITSHQHRHCIHEPLFNLGSYSRWEFDQEEEKGFGYIIYDTDTNMYSYTQINNPFTPKYITHEFKTSDFISASEMTEVVKMIKKNISDDKSSYYRIKVIVDDDSADKAAFVSGIKDQFINIRRVKVTVTNLKKKKAIEKEEAHTRERINHFSYLTSAELSTLDKITKFITDERHVEIPDEVYEKYVRKYLSNK